MNPFIVEGHFADQGAPQAFGKSVAFSTKPSKLFYLTAFNKSGATVYIELYDHPSAATGTPRVLPCGAGGFTGWATLKMRNGIFVRAVDAASGGSVIAGDDVKFDCGFCHEIV
jgi:hypothetical protein